jgi:hypothetical protein
VQASKAKTAPPGFGLDVPRAPVVDVDVAAGEPEPEDCGAMQFDVAGSGFVTMVRNTALSATWAVEGAG